MIIGKSGFQVGENDALDYVWGYTIINGKRKFFRIMMNVVAHDLHADVTAREKQRDHKQFYLGKSPDTFCPMVDISLLFRLKLGD